MPETLFDARAEAPATSISTSAETSTATSAETTTRRRRSRMIRAILAGGLVLGVGAAVTLAAWTDTENVYGDFTVGKFNLEGSLDNAATFSDHAAPGSPLVFKLPATVAALSPGDSVYAPLSLRLAAGTTNSATITVASTLTSGSVAGLSLVVYNTGTSTVCDNTVTTGAIAGFGTALTTAPAGTLVTLAPGANATTPGTAVNLCYKVTAGSQASLTQGQTGRVTWVFTGTSI